LQHAMRVQDALMGDRYGSAVLPTILEDAAESSTPREEIVTHGTSDAAVAAESDDEGNTSGAELLGGKEPAWQQNREVVDGPRSLTKSAVLESSSPPGRNEDVFVIPYKKEGQMPPAVAPYVFWFALIATGCVILLVAVAVPLLATSRVGIGLFNAVDTMPGGDINAAGSKLFISHLEWEVVGIGAVPVRAEKSVSGAALSTVLPGQIIFGRQDGAWLELLHGRGWIKLKDDDTGEARVQGLTVSYMKVSHGNCADAGKFPVTDAHKCEAAAIALGIDIPSPRTNGWSKPAPEGCYLKDGETVWLATNAQNRGRGAVRGREQLCSTSAFRTGSLDETAGEESPEEDGAHHGSDKARASEEPGKEAREEAPWEVGYGDPLPVYSAKDTSSDTLGTVEQGEVIFGLKDGDWFSSKERGGYIKVEEWSRLKQLTASYLKITHSTCAKVNKFPITTASECEAAAAALRLPRSGVTTQYWVAPAPEGCYRKGNELWLSINPVNRGVGAMPGRESICSSSERPVTGETEWEVTPGSTITIRSSKSRSAMSLGLLKAGAVVVGRADGDWIRLFRDRGYVRAKAGGETRLERRHATYGLITKGTCADIGQFSITDASACEAASVALNLHSTIAKIQTWVTPVPEGCYIKEDHLWLSTSAKNVGWGVVGDRYPVCSSRPYQKRTMPWSDNFTTSDSTEWEAVRDGAVVYSERGAGAERLGHDPRPRGWVFFGARDGDWLELFSKRGYVRIMDGDEDLLKAREASYLKTSIGRCSDFDKFPILDEAACEAAASRLGIRDTKVHPALPDVEAPEGCYLKENKELFLQLGRSSVGNGAMIAREPICSSRPHASLADHGPVDS